MAKEAIGIRSYNTYIKALNDLIDFGFIVMVEQSKNQYSSNIVALSKYNKPLNKALDKALIKHGAKQSESIDSIDKQETIKQVTKNATKVATLEKRISEFKNEVDSYSDKYSQDMLTAFYLYWTEKNKGAKKFRAEMQKVFDMNLRLINWEKRNKNMDFKKDGQTFPDYYNEKFVRMNCQDPKVYQEYQKHLRGLGWKQVTGPGGSSWIKNK